MITKQQIKALLNNWTTFGKWNDEMKKELASQIFSFISKEREETLKSVLPKGKEKTIWIMNNGKALLSFIKEKALKNWGIKL